MSVGPDDACQRARLGMEFRNAISVQMPSVCVSLSVCVEKSVAHLCACLAQSGSLQSAATSLLTLLSYCKLIWPEMISSVLKSELVVLLLPCRVVVLHLPLRCTLDWQLATGSGQQHCRLCLQVANEHGQVHRHREREQPTAAVQLQLENS